MTLACRQPSRHRPAAPRLTHRNSDAPNPSIVDFCATDAVAVDAFNVLAYLGSSVDSNGLHAITRSEIFATSSDYHKSSIFSATSNANASLQDMLHFSAAAPIVGYADLTLSAVGNIGLGGSMTSQLTVSDGTSTAEYKSCFFGYGGGSCTVKLLVHFADGVSVYDGISVFANATIGQGYGSAATSITNFQDTAFISEVQFTDVAGNPLDLTYTTDSGYRYPQASTVPEPATWLLWLCAAPLLLRASPRGRP